MKNNRPQEKTLVLIKPDGVQRSLIGEIIHRYERTGLKLVGLKFFTPSTKLVEQHYLMDKGWLEAVGNKSIASYKKRGKKLPFSDSKKCGLRILETLKKYLSAGPVVAMVWQGNEAVGIVRKITGGTEPLTSDVGTIRGDLTLDSIILADIDGRAVRNLIHASGSSEEANKEIKIWFKPSEIVKYRLVQEEVLYDVDLNGIME
ncbi:nucleoside-diphosphate kinase [Patescibacteria group bacterium]|nr:nucleoside-diphosphate kinase [Patescibacteria group bacterium]MBU1563687.1 nucleoside-diphosphate kinase [Patescibacteria group bacterium]